MIHIGPADGRNIVRPDSGCGPARRLDWFVVGTVAGLTSAGVLLLPMLFVYYIAMWGWKGTSLGGMVMNTKLVRDRGRPINFAAATVRSDRNHHFNGRTGARFRLVRRQSHEEILAIDYIAGTNVCSIPEGAQIKWRSRCLQSFRPEIVAGHISPDCGSEAGHQPVPADSRSFLPVPRCGQSQPVLPGLRRPVNARSPLLHCTIMWPCVRMICPYP